MLLSMPLRLSRIRIPHSSRRLSPNLQNSNIMLSTMRGYATTTKVHQFRQRLERDRPSLTDFLSQNSSSDQESNHNHPSFSSSSSSSLDHILAHLRTQNMTDNNTLDQKLVLQDTFGRHHSYLRISLTERCNLRCTYCMPSEGVTLQPPPSLLSTSEILDLASMFATWGVRKIRLTGGEPLLRPDLVELCSGLRAIPGIDALGITTNGLQCNPERVTRLFDAGVTQFNVSLDTLSRHTFEKLTRRRGFNRVLDNVHGILNYIEQHPELNLPQLKLNVVVMKGKNDHELIDFVRLTQDLPIIVRFIEWMPFDKNRWSDEHFVSYRDMLTSIQQELDDTEIDTSTGAEPTKWMITKCQDGPHDTTKHYRVSNHAKGQFGFITSMTQHFCGTCNRLRLTADGNLKVCLFDHHEVSLRDALRRRDVSREELAQLIDLAVNRKQRTLGGHENMYRLAQAKNRPMILIGG